MKRLVEIATPTHAWAVSIYVVQAFQGILYMVGIAQAKGMTEMLSEQVPALWALVLVVAGGGAAAAVFAARRPAYTLPALRIELLCCLTIAAASLLYEVTLVYGNGPLGVATTQSYALMLIVGGIARAAQIRRERAKVNARLGEAGPAIAASTEDGAE